MSIGLILVQVLTLAKNYIHLEMYSLLFPIWYFPIWYRFLLYALENFFYFIDTQHNVSLFISNLINFRSSLSFLVILVMRLIINVNILNKELSFHLFLLFYPFYFINFRHDLNYLSPHAAFGFGLLWLCHSLQLCQQVIWDFPDISMSILRAINFPYTTTFIVSYMLWYIVFYLSTTSRNFHL